MSPDPRQRRELWSVVTAAGDVLITLTLLAAIVMIRRNVPLPFTRSVLPVSKFEVDLLNAIVFAVAAILSMGISGFYSRTTSRRHRPLMLIAIVIEMLLLATFAFFSETMLPRTVVGGVVLGQLILLPLWRRVVTAAIRVAPRSLILVGSRERLASLHASSSGREDFGIGGVVEVGDLTNAYGSAVATRIIASADEVLDVGGGDEGRRRLEIFQLRGARGLLFVPHAADALTARAPIFTFCDQPVCRISAAAVSSPASIVKRLVDVAGALLLLMAASPLFVAIAAVLYATGGKVLLKQKRVGLNGEVFDLLKFCTMRGSRSPVRATDNDERITRVGSILRRYRLDELPQLVNVLRGEMSLVGPRPELPEICRQLESANAAFALRHLVRPGIAGLAQVTGEYDQSSDVKLTADLQYIVTWSSGLDALLFVRAVSVALSGRGV